MRVCLLLCAVVSAGLVLNDSHVVTAQAQKPGVMALIASPAATSATRDAEKPLRRFYTRANLHVQNKDFKALADLCESTWTSDWTAADTAGQSHSRDELIKLMRNPRPGLMSEGSSQFIVKKISLQGDRAYVDSVQKLTRTEADAEGKYGPKGKRHRLTRTEPVRDTWVKQAGVWKIQHSRSYPMAFEVDGKPTKN